MIVGGRSAGSGLADLQPDPIERFYLAVIRQALGGYGKLYFAFFATMVEDSCGLAHGAFETLGGDEFDFHADAGN